MVRWANAILWLFICVATPLLAQAGNQSDTPGQGHVSDSGPSGKSAAGQTADTVPVAVYPLDLFQDFSAVMAGSRAEPGEGTSQGHIYRHRGQIRMEEPGGHAYFITDLGSGESYGIVRSRCIHDDHPYIRAIPFYIAGKADATVTRTSGGKETVDGHSCLIEEVTVSSPILANAQKMRFWEAEDLHGFPIKIEFVVPGDRGPIIRYKNVVLGAQDATLFVHPSSCRPLPQ